MVEIEQVIRKVETITSCVVVSNDTIETLYDDNDIWKSFLHSSVAIATIASIAIATFYIDNADCWCYQRESIQRYKPN